MNGSQRISNTIDINVDSNRRTSMQSLTVPQPVDDRPSTSSSSFLSKLSDAKKSLFGKSNAPDPTFSSATQSKALLSYVLSEPNPQLATILEFESEGAHLNCVTDEGNTIAHLLARADLHSEESINIIEYLTKKSLCDVSKQNDYGWTAAHYALASRNTDFALQLLKSMDDVNLSSFENHLDYAGQTSLLHIAARKNDSVVIRLLIKTYKARVNVFNEDGCTPLHICCYENTFEALKALLENDADFQKGTRLNPLETPIAICVKFQHDECLKAIFEASNSFNWKRYFSQLNRSPLLCDFPSIQSIEILVEHSLDINSPDERGNTFLHYLVNKKQIDYESYIEKLVEKSADFNRQNILGRTPFLSALEQNNFDILAVFLRYMQLTNINLLDRSMNTVLHYCKFITERFIFESVLQSKPDALNAQNRDGNTPLHDAIIYDNYPFAEFLLRCKCDVTLTNKDGNTVLHLAARDDNVRMCKILLKQSQPDLTAVNRMGKTALHLACANEKANVAAILLNKMNNEQMNITDIQGRTALHECAPNLNGFLARYLVRHGADENAKDLRGNTIVHLATEKGNLELVQTLIKSSNANINQLNLDNQSPLGLSILYNHDEVGRFLLEQDKITIQGSDLKIALQMNNCDMVRSLIEKDRSCLHIRSNVHGDLILHTYMRQNLNNAICLETLLSFVNDNELLNYLSETSLVHGDSLLHIAAREDTPNALTCFLNIPRVKFWFWANMMLVKNNDNKTPMELANEFKHYSVIKLTNAKWKESYEHLSHSLRDGHCGVSPTGVTQAKRHCFYCNQSGFTQASPGQNIRPCEKCNVCLYKSLDNSMQVFLALLFSDESSTIALDIMDSLIVVNEVQKVVHLYLDHIEPWEELDKSDNDDSTSLLGHLVIAPDGRKMPPSNKESPGTPVRHPFDREQRDSSSANSKTPTGLGASTSGGSAFLTAGMYAPRPSVTHKYRPDGTRFRPITPLEAIYYHERLDLITHPLIKGLIKWKWDNFAGKRFYIGLGLELLFLISWTCCSLLTPFPIRYVYRFPQDIWRCILWIISIMLLIGHMIQEMFDISYTRQRYEDYLIWESDRRSRRLDYISKNRNKQNSNAQTSNTMMKKAESVVRLNAETGGVEHIVLNETTSNIVNANPILLNVPSHHSQHHPLPPTIPPTIKGRTLESSATNETKWNDANEITNDSVAPTPAAKRRRRSRVFMFAEAFRQRARRRLKSYYMYYSLNNLFDWIIYILSILTLVTHIIDVSKHTVLRARIHMYVASVTVLCMWFRFMVFFRTIIISMTTLRSKSVEIKLGELVIMVRMMFDDIIRFLLVFLFLLAPYAFVFYAVFGGQQVLHNDYESSPALCEHALLHCTISELKVPYDGNSESYRARGQFIFNGSLSGYQDEQCQRAKESCRLIEPSGFETFYSLLFSIFRIALVDDIPIDSFTAIDRYFAAFVCATYLLFTAILSINIFIGLISNALQTEAFSTVEARFLLERIEVILGYEWRFSKDRRAQIQEIIHRFCSPLQLNWKDINFDAYGRSREDQQTKALLNFRQVIDKQNIQFDTFRLQFQQKLVDIDNSLTKIQGQARANASENSVLKSPVLSRRPSSQIHTNESQVDVLTELIKIRELFEETLVGGATRASRSSTISNPTMRRPTGSLSVRNQLLIDGNPLVPIYLDQQNPQDLSERVTDLQLAINRLHQDVGAIRQVIERISPLSTAILIGRASARR